MKYLIVLAVVLGIAWLMLGRGRRGPGDDEGKTSAGEPGKARKAGKAREPDAPVPMLACAHCGVHLPRGDAVADPQGRPFCTDAHRLAGPR